MTLRYTKNIHKPALAVIAAIAVTVFLRAAFPASASAGIWDDILLTLLLCTGMLILLSLRSRILQLLRGIPPLSPLRSKPVEEFFVKAAEERVFFFVRSLMGRGSRITEQGRSLFILRRKGKVGAWGSIVFHVGILALLVGLLLSTRMGERHGFSLTEGEKREVTPDAITVELKEVDPEYNAGAAVTSASILLSGTGSQVDESAIYVNNSHVTDAWVVHHTGIWGYAPVLVILTDDDSLLMHAAVRLSAQCNEKSAFEDSAVVPGTETMLHLCLYPDFRRTEYGDSSISNLPQNPVLTVSMRQEDGVSAVFDLAQGQHADAAGLRFIFPRLRKWSRLEAVRDPGMLLLFWGCLLCVVGLLLRLLFTRRMVEVELHVTAAGTHVALRGRCEKYPCTLREELRLLAERIRAEYEGAVTRTSWQKRSMSEE